MRTEIFLKKNNGEGRLTGAVRWWKEMEWGWEGKERLSGVTEDCVLKNETEKEISIWKRTKRKQTKLLVFVTDPSPPLPICNNSSTGRDQEARSIWSIYLIHLCTATDLCCTWKMCGSWPLFWWVFRLHQPSAGGDALCREQSPLLWSLITSFLCIQKKTIPTPP